MTAKKSARGNARAWLSATSLSRAAVAGLANVVLVASVSTALAQAQQMTPYNAPPYGGNNPVNQPASAPPLFWETSSGANFKLGGLTDAENAQYQQLTADIKTISDNQEALNDQWTTNGYAALCGGELGTANANNCVNPFFIGLLPDGPEKDQRLAAKAIFDQWNAYNAQATTVRDQLKPLQKKITADPGGVTCAAQLDDPIFGLEVAGTSVDLAGTILEAATSPGSWLGIEVASNVLQAVGVGISLVGHVLTGIQNDLPECEIVATGTIQTYANMQAKMGLSTFDGAITLGYDGNPNYVDGIPAQYFYNGITLGGGGLAGAGNGGLQAFTGHVSAIAIGNGARAESENSTAIGNGARAALVGDTAIGANAQATGGNATAVGTDSAASGARSTALGYSSNASGPDSIAIGDANATGQDSIAAGRGANATNTDAIAIGRNSLASSVGAVAIGAGAQATGSTAIGFGALATGTDSAAFGEDAQAIATNTAAFGEFSRATAANATAMGRGTQAIAQNATALGQAALANQANATASGQDAQATGANATANGQGARATAANATATGQDAQALAANATANGQGSRATAANASAYGQGAQATAANATANGQGSRATAANASAYGQDAQATAADATATGQGSRATAGGTVAYGQNARATASGASAFGQNTLASNTNAMAYGFNANATHANSAAFGPNVNSVADNNFIFGQGSTTYRLPGVGSLASYTRQTNCPTIPNSIAKGCDIVTADAEGDLGTTSIRSITDPIYAEARQGSAMALAMGGLGDLQPGEKYVVTGAWGTYESESALAMALTARFDENLAFNAGVGIGTGDRAPVGARAGFRLGW